MHYAEERPERYVSVKTILEDYEAPATRSKIEGHIVFIGTSAAGLLDIRTTSLGQTVPGVSIHAQAVEQILSSTFLSRPDWADGLEIALVFALGILIIAIATGVGPLLGILAGAAIALASAAASWAAFRYNQFLIDPTMPVASALATLFVMTAFRFLVSDRERRTIRRAFSQYLAPSLLSRIESSPDALKLGGDERQLTLMFMDVRGFTSISEVLNPIELVDFMNKLLNELSRPIIREEGTLDKFIGDSIMAFWNAPVDVPDHAKRAATAALDMRAALRTLNSQDAFNLKWRLGDSAEIGIGIGINTGLACVGNMGAETRFNYSAVGDAVNLAARIESSAKHLGHDIVISEFAASALQDMAMLEAGHLELKGKSARQRLYVLVGDRDSPLRPISGSSRAFHETLIRHLASGEIAGHQAGARQVPGEGRQARLVNAASVLRAHHRPARRLSELTAREPFSGIRNFRLTRGSPYSTLKGRRHARYRPPFPFRRHAEGRLQRRETDREGPAQNGQERLLSRVQGGSGEPPVGDRRPDQPARGCLCRNRHKAVGKKCEAMAGLVKEASGLMEEVEDERTLDAGIIMAAQSVEHYEIARYGTLITWARELELNGVQELLQETLDQEKAADEKLSSLAESYVNREAA